MELTDAERLNWLERVMFDKHWCGTIGVPSDWRLAGPHRHELAKMHGNTLREAIDSAAFYDSSRRGKNGD